MRALASSSFPLSTQSNVYDSPLWGHHDENKVTRGIYLYEEKDGQRKMTQLEPSVSKQQKTGGVFASAMTGSLAKIRFKAALSSANAPLQIASPHPVFYIYFEVKNAGLSSNSYYATSPSEFVLVALDSQEPTREVSVSQANAFRARSGTMIKQRVRTKSRSWPPASIA